MRSLLIGDGNMSFAKALTTLNTFPQLGLSSRQLVVSVCESEEEWNRKFYQHASTLSVLKEAGVNIVYDVNVSDKNKTLDKLLSMRPFDAVVFNFPHPGGKSNVRLSRKLLIDYFTACHSLLSTNGCAILSLLDGQCELSNKDLLKYSNWSPNGEEEEETIQHCMDSWLPINCAASCGYLLRKAKSFPVELLTLAGYENTGFRGTTRKFGKLDSAITLYFEIVPVASIFGVKEEPERLCHVHPLRTQFKHHLSFWLAYSELVHLVKIKQAIYDFSKKLVKKIDQLDCYRPPGECNRVGICLELTWQSHDRTLNRTLANSFQEALRGFLVKWSQSHCVTFQLR